MKIFIFEEVERVSGRYHSEGGLVIIAKDLQSAIDLAQEDKYKKLQSHEIEKVVSYDLLDDDVDPRLWVFPNSGCC